MYMYMYVHAFTLTQEPSDLGVGTPSVTVVHSTYMYMYVHVHVHALLFPLVSSIIVNQYNLYTAKISSSVACLFSQHLALNKRKACAKCVR